MFTFNDHVDSKDLELARIKIVNRNLSNKDNDRHMTLPRNSENCVIHKINFTN